MLSSVAALPLPEPPPDQARCGLEYAVARISSSGRVCVWPLLDRLGWPDSVRLTTSVIGTSVLLQPDPRGVFSLGKRRMVVVPIALRRRCGMSTGDAVLLVADPVGGVLVVHPAQAVDQMVLRYHAALAGGDHDDR
jgi:bifunctional DNA-binding transcriptional regulator/antitoxin component of YhaV-PrlF toxin-antitoxin module